MASTTAVVLTEAEVLALRTAMIQRLHVELVNGGNGAALYALLKKLGWTREAVAPAPFEGREKDRDA